MPGTSPYAQLGYEQIAAVTATAFTLDPTKYTKTVGKRTKTANYILFVPDGTCALRWRADGTAPTATVGSAIAAGSSLALALNPQDFKGIASVAGNVSVSYFYA